MGPWWCGSTTRSRSSSRTCCSAVYGRGRYGLKRVEGTRVDTARLHALSALPASALPRKGLHLRDLPGPAAYLPLPSADGASLSRWVAKPEVIDQSVFPLTVEQNVSGRWARWLQSAAVRSTGRVSKVRRAVHGARGDGKCAGPAPAPLRRNLQRWLFTSCVQKVYSVGVPCTGCESYGAAHSTEGDAVRRVGQVHVLQRGPVER